ncbi:MAG: membrane protein insertase YidC [Christensenellales bacterium]
MDFLAITLTKPTGLWESIIFGMENSLRDYALALIIVTILIKLVMVPFDFVNKYSSKKSARKQAEMKPELDKVNAKYANDKNMLNQKTMEVYKSHNYNVMGTCVGMLVYLVFTMVVFWTLFASLNKISYYKIGDQFLQVRREYFASYSIDVDALGDETTALDEYNLVIKDLTEEQLVEFKASAETNANAKYQETKTGFLWIENIWLADSTTNPVMKYSDFIKKSGISESQITEAEYNLIMEPIKTGERKNNGYFVLAVLAAGLNFLSMQVNTWVSKRKAKKQGIDPALMTNTGSNKLMSIIMPVIMGVFTLFYNAAFGLYIVAGALITLITSPLVTMFVDILEVEAIKKEQNRNVAIYDRKRRK